MNADLFLRVRADQIAGALRSFWFFSLTNGFSEEKRCLILEEMTRVKRLGDRHVTPDEFSEISHRIWNLAGIKLDFFKEE